MLFRIAIIYVENRLFALTIVLLIMLLPPAQINSGWVTNFVPGALNASIVILAAHMFISGLVSPQWSRSKFCFSMLLLLGSFFIYPPTGGFFFTANGFMRLLHKKKNSEKGL